MHYVQYSSYKMFNVKLAEMTEKLVVTINR